MKSIVFLILCTFTVKAQTITATGTHFVEGVKDKNWSNVNGTNFTKAKFKSFEGSCYNLITVDETVEVSFRALSSIKSGRLEFFLANEQENQLFFCGTTNSCELLKTVTLEKGKNYKLFFTGRNAKGNYEVTWDINKK
jgi:hypothetical protein